ncbi:spore coat protein [Mahella sp.]|uniref:spore coat protein n=1 Tax=Mahella sp. TaxID=2798721 RepID=UPI0025BD3E82|nr:spore coat protein [Mahella sp.]MBZ4666725.1 Coat domain protein [Mahella sp.]
MPQNQMGFDDRIIADDCLTSQKTATSNYNIACTEAASEDLRDDLRNILNDELQNQAMIWNVMNRKGWYPVKQANQQDISAAQQKFRNMQSQIQQ